METRKAFHKYLHKAQATPTLPACLKGEGFGMSSAERFGWGVTLRKHWNVILETADQLAL
jgi:hypothetical protein